MTTTLRLTVINAPADSPLTGQQLDVSVAGSTLGRGGSNAIILPDHERIVSSHHASIRHDLGQYVLTDHSTNGTFVNDSPTPIGPEKSVPLQNGDIITMGKYRFQVNLVSAVAAAPAASSGFLDDLGLAPPSRAAASPFDSPAPGPAAADIDDFDKWLEPQAAPARQDPLWGISNVEHVDTGGFEDISDPLAAIEKAHQNDQPFPTSPSNLLDDDPDWWKNSQQDNASPLNQAFSAPHSIQAEPTPVPPPAPVFEQPPAFAAQAPALPVVDDADNLDALLGLDSTPAAPMAPEPTPVPAPIQWEATPVPPPIVAEPTPVPAAITPEPTPVPPLPPAAPGVAAEAPVDTTTAPAASYPTDAGELLAKLLELGNLPPEQLQRLPGDITAVLLQTIRGLVDMLRARSSIKNELRIDRTMIRPVENNPLKFALTEKDALRYLFGERSGAYMPGPRAVEEAFADIEQHQVALLAGMRAAYEKMLADFSPAALEQRFGNAVHKGLLGNKKSALWDAYTEYFDKLQQDPEASYNRLFGETFADAYEEQANTIKHGSRDPSRSR